MTTLYKPVLIESAEQAEALPIGTVAYDPETVGLVGIRTPKSSYFPWHCSFDHDPTAYSSNVVGWTALVPIEAEEEFTATGEDHGDPWIANLGFDGLDGTREEAEAYTRRFGGVLARRLAAPWEEV